MICSRSAWPSWWFQRLSSYGCYFGAAIIQDAANLRTRLRMDCSWILARDSGAMGVSDALLRKRDLIWLDERGDGECIRDPAGVK